mgnify:CR=1 FL=1
MREVNIARAVELYYSRLALSNKDIKEIFSVKSDSTVAQIKREVMTYFANSDVNPIFGSRLKTYETYIAMGLDIKDLENRYRKLRRLLPDFENMAKIEPPTKVGTS